ncbi:RagB/SusD family nutrient uptake outer membrane protein [Chitinophaga silvatica]|uniref:RagB/SusD family nutrient uptake outer membrane protein n=1 Tax=Chitinophaga silvatica TaxID=2282649 RepID=A0A3E1Y761_9BACT|nr:RagB/SusD family nutrient uptake outer membrane protein [Chitinophaga silvatica]RFS20741.1 RagB/SusD family nutrient uptake outer membrane protein [Chitinophaga silvatica]
MSKTNNKLYKVSGSLVLFLVLCSCKKFVDVNPPVQQLLKNEIYNNSSTAIGVLNQSFVFMHYMDTWGIGGIPIQTGLLGDELIYYKPGEDVTLTAFYTDNLNSKDVFSTNVWTQAYQNIFYINDAIEGVGNSSLNQSIKQQLLGEAKFMRGLCYFYLVNIYGDVPIVLTTDHTKNSLITRASQSDVWNIIKSDLNDAYNLLSNSFLNGTLTGTSTDRVRPTKWAAAALLAKVYLYNKNWDLAEEKSNEVINNTSLFKLDSLNGVFKKNSIESILQFQSVNYILNTFYGQYFILPDNSQPSTLQPTYLSNHLINSFEIGDERKNKWVGYSYTAIGTYPYAYKYKEYKTINYTDPITENYVTLRLGEQYLIRAEARVQQNNLSGALTDLNTIRNRANLSGSSAVTKDQIIDAIDHERQVELFLEQGDRWFDLRRAGKLDSVMQIVAPEKGGTWSSYKQYYPIEIGELKLNPNLQQNPGY